MEQTNTTSTETSTHFRNFCITKDDGIVYCSVNPRRTFLDPLSVDKIYRDIPNGLPFEPQSSATPFSSHTSSFSLPNATPPPLTINPFRSCTSTSSLQPQINAPIAAFSANHLTSNALPSPFGAKDNADFLERSMPSTLELLGNSCESSNAEQHAIWLEHRSSHSSERVFEGVSQMPHVVGPPNLGSATLPAKFSVQVPSAPTPTMPVLAEPLDTYKVLQLPEAPSSKCIAHKGGYYKTPNREHNSNINPEGVSNLKYSAAKKSNDKAKKVDHGLELSPYITQAQASKRQRILGTEKAQREINAFAAIITTRINYEETLKKKHTATQNHSMSSASTDDDTRANFFQLTENHPASKNVEREGVEWLSDDEVCD